MEYKGYILIVEEKRNAPKALRYLAKAINGSDAAFGETEDDALIQLKQKIDNIPAFQGIQSLPLDSIHLEMLRNIITENEVFIRRKLNQKHYILQDEYGLGYRALLHHCDFIQETLNTLGNSFELGVTEKEDPHTGRHSLILYDKLFYKSENELCILIRKLSE